MEALSARTFRLRTACGYSVYELGAKASVMPRTIHRLESGKPVDKRCLPALAAALGVRTAGCFVASTVVPNERACPRCGLLAQLRPSRRSQSPWAWIGINRHICDFTVA